MKNSSALKYILLAILALSILITVTFCAGAQVKNPITLRIANINSIESGNGQMMKKFAELVEERTDGKVKFLLFPSGQLGGEIDNMEALMTGTLDMCIVGYSQMAAYVPEVMMVDLPYIWKSEEHLVKFWDSETGKDFIKRYEEATGTRALNFNGVGAERHILANKPIRTLEDVKGLKIRVTQGYPHHYDAFLALGASPVYMAFPEVYTALQQNVIDAMENPLDDMYGAKFYEAAKYVSLTGHIQNSHGMLIGKSAREKITPETLEIMTIAAREAGEYKTEVVHRLVEEALVKMEAAGVTFTEPDIESFAQRVRDQLMPAYINKFEDGQKIYDAIQAIE